MNTLHLDHHLVRDPAGRLVRATIAALILAICSDVAGATAEPAKEETKSYSLFMGADFDIQQGKEFHRVEDVSGGSFIVTVDRKLVMIPMDKGQVNMKIRQDLKLGSSAVVIKDLTKDRAYTPGNDPYQKFLRAQQGLNASNATDLHNGKLNHAENSLAYYSNNPDSHRPANVIVDAQAKVASVQREVDADAIYARNEINSIGFHASRLDDELSKELFDAIKVSFVASSSKPLLHPYLVIVAEYHDPSEAPGVKHNWIYATELDAITSQPHQVKITRGGLAPGFILGKFQVHLYNRGHEVATTAADNQVPMDRQEAFDFIVINYLGSNKNSTLPAKPAMGRPSAEIHDRLSSSQLARQYFVKVSKDGFPGEAYLDESCTQKIVDPDVQTIVENLRFTPSLDQGRPVDAVAKFKLAELGSIFE